MVRDGAKAINEAFERAEKERRENDTDEKRIGALLADFAALVREERMKLSEAAAAFETRKSEARARIENARRAISGFAMTFAAAV